jgi:hypothetical protein
MEEVRCAGLFQPISKGGIDRGRKDDIAIPGAEKRRVVSGGFDDDTH